MKILSLLTAFAILLLFISSSLQQNYDFDTASSVSTLPTSIAIDNSLSPSDATLNLCTDLASASSFIWYKIDAANTLRTITIDTCDVDFDSVIGVFSGTSFASLASMGCNDDRSSNTASCNPSSSLLMNINVASGETVYIVVGGFIDPNTLTASVGSGHLQVTVIDQSTLQCSSDLILQVEADIHTDITVLQSNVTSTLTSATNTLESDLSSLQTSITSAVNTAESQLSSDLQTLQNSADNIETVVNATSSTVDSISSLLSTVNTNVNTIHSDLQTADTNVDALGSQVDTLATNEASAFTATNANIDTLQSSADQMQLLANQLLANASSIITTNNDIASQITSFQNAVLSSFNTVNDDLLSLNSQLDAADTNIVTIQTDITTIEQSISAVSGKISSLSSSVTSNFAATNVNIAALQSSANQLISLSNNMLDSSSAIQTQQNNIASALNDFESSSDTSFGAALDALTTVNTAVSSVNQTSQASFSDRAAELSTLQTSCSSIQSDVSNSKSILNSLQSNLNSDGNYAVFVDSLIRYLPDKTITNPPFFLRMPNNFGGRMNDVASYVNAQYSLLKTNANAIGSKTSSQCTSNAFCNYFLNTADAAYTDSISKYNSYLNAKKFFTAYTYLQQAFINLYPSTW